MTKSTFGDLSTTPAGNTIIDGSDVSENCPMPGLNNAIRSLGAMGAGALTYVITVGTDTYSAALVPTPDALATNFQYLVGFASPNTSPTPTINFGFGAKTIVLCDGVTPLVAGSLNGCHILEYDGTNMRLINPHTITTLADATNGGLNFTGTLGAVTANLKPSDLLTKTVPTNSDSVLIMDAAASNVAKTATIPQVVGAFFAPITNSMSGDVALNNTATYFAGPSVAQGTVGTWFASGTVTLSSTSQDVMQAKLWDGTTVLASAEFVALTNLATTVSLSGFIANPVGNIRISVRDPTTTGGTMSFNLSGNSKDSTVTAIRIG